MIDPGQNPSSEMVAEFPIVGVGASAGGLEALLHLFRDMDSTPGMAFVVVQHLSPDFDTMVDDLLARQTRLTIRLAQNETQVEPDTIYVMPPKVEMIIAGGRLLLTEREPDRGLWLPIDVFFRSLAEDAGGRAVGIVLSGTGSDGSRGLRAIHDTGGLTIAQDPRTAKFDGMPRSAIDTGIVDLVLPPEEIRHALTRYAQRLAKGLRSVEILPESNDGATSILEVLHKETGVDFSHYKTTTIGRRLDRRLLLTGALDIDTYADKVRTETEERDLLYQDLLIGVTSFFRELRAFDVLAKAVIPELIRKLGDDQELRVWSAGCATGEEAYSLAIMILEQFRLHDMLPRLRLFATDVYPRSLETASAGSYDAEHIHANVAEDLIERYFVRQGERYQVRSEVRSRVVFARHNLLRDAPFTRLDLISCRNVLIYFKPAAQKKLIALFHFALRAGGMLFLGPSESPNVLGDEFTPVDRRWKIYRKRREVRIPPELHILGAQATRFPAVRPSSQANLQMDAIERARHALLERHAPPTLLISSAQTLIHSSYGGNRFLRTPDGAPSVQILDLVEGELKYALAGALRRAADERRVVCYEHVPAATAEGPVKVRLTVMPQDSEMGQSFLVTLEPQETPAIQADSPNVDVLARERIESLELELRYAKENLQATIEEMEAANEELQATNEELIASNEELHSANEELQSVNEELHSVNVEHQAKIQELRELSADMEHLLAATEVHTLFLDGELALRKFTPKMGETFRIRPADIGRRIDDFAHRLLHDGLIADLESVLATGERIEREVRDRDGAWYLMRILPYEPPLESGGGALGVVLTLFDITSVRTAERELGERDAIIHGFLEYSPALLWARDRQGRYLLASQSLADLFGATPSDIVGKDMFELGGSRMAEAAVLGRDEHVFATGKPMWSEDENHQPEGTRYLHAIRFPLRDLDGNIYAVAGVGSDITDRKQAEEDARTAVERRDRFLAMLSHELRNPLAAISNGLHLLEESEDADRRKRTQAIIRHQLDHLSRLLDDLLDVTRIVQGRMRVHKETFSLNEVAEAVARASAPRFQSRGISFTTRLPAQDVLLYGDPMRIEQVLMELLENAAKFTGRGGAVELEIGVEGELASVHVRDTGLGLTPEEHERVFELFYQRDESLDRRESGLGVGLALARDLVTSHGGTIEARSNGHEQGSEFVVCLPAARLSAPAARSQKSASAPASCLRVAIIEDSPDSLELLQLFLEHLGHETYTADSGVHGLTVIEAKRPDVAFIDIGLPGMSGLELARAIRSNPDTRDTYLVALTGYGRAEDRQASSDAGFDEHLTKPVGREALERVLREASEQGVRD